MSRADTSGSRLRPPDPSLLRALDEAVPDGVAARATDRLGMAHDASHYLLIPQAVVRPRSADDVARLLRASATVGVPLTFRSGGTSLSGQSSSSGVLVDTRRHFRDIEVLDHGARVRVRPGATVRSVNVRLARHGRKLGPDPASESACTIGGVVANNSSGMACGTEANTYRTLESAVVVLPSGTVLDTGSERADEQLRTLEPLIHDGLLRLRDRVRADAASVATIRRLFSLKNTMGYSINAFLDHDRPVDMLLHLIVGSEGTLAFVAEATFRTVPVHHHVATGLLVFPNLAGATAALPALVDSGLATIELLDATSLRVAQTDPASPDLLREVAVTDHAALLVEHQRPDAEALAEGVQRTAEVLADLELAAPGVLASEPGVRSALWHVRKGLYTAVAGARPSGTTALLEDIAVPVSHLLDTCRELTDLFDHHGYEGSVIFGHAKDGNIHFLLNERFDQPALVQRYRDFTEDLVDLVLRHGGTLKAEHGTGRVMAPFVRRQYGDELFEVMRQVKALLDPVGLLNPGVLVDDDEHAHLRDLKQTPAVEAEVDRCVECGYCEPVCPSADLTTTPRQRIVLRREIERARAAGETELLATLLREYEYDAVETCAADGMCQTACPVLIDTGDLTRRLRAQSHTPVAERAAQAAARHWDGATRAASAGLTLARLAPSVSAAVTRAARTLLDDDVVPQWSRDLGKGGRRRTAHDTQTPVAVHLPSCTATMFGSNGCDDSPGASAAFMELCRRAGVAIRIPKEVASLCCGTPWKSKGLGRGHAQMRGLVLPALMAATHDGALPVVVDASSCTEGLGQLLAPEPRLEVVDAVAFVNEHVLAQLSVTSPVPSLTLHPTCSSTRLGLDGAFTRIAQAAAERVIVPESWGCCAFAGDRGLLHPELTASATRAETAEVLTADAEAHASLNRACEVGMTRATGRPYRHILEVLVEVTEP